MKKRSRVFEILVLSGILNQSHLYGEEITLYPCEDVYIRTVGGGDGRSVFMKFDISSIPLGQQIDSVFLEVYVCSVHGNWNGNVNFFNVNNQEWTESTSATVLWGFPTSDSITQYAGFGMGGGWTKSIPLTYIFKRDYNAGNTYCTIKMKDPDDPTYSPTESIDSNDTLMLGFWWPYTYYIQFYPHEHGDSIPRLIVYCTIGVYFPGCGDSVLTLQNYPNPFTQKTLIELRVKSLELRDLKLQIYDLAGRLVKSFPLNSQLFVVWDGRDKLGDRVPASVYFCKLQVGDYTVVRKICLVR